MEERVYKELEKINQEKKDIYFSKEMYRGRTLINLIKCIKSVNFAGIIDIFAHHNAVKVVNNNYSYLNKELYINESVAESNKKIAVYTCMIGNYDKLMSPICLEDNVDYYVITDCKDEFDGWQKINIPDELLSWDKTKINRYIKMHPNIFFENYNYTIYIDANMRIVGNPYSFCGAADNSNLGIAFYEHKERNCIYEEAEVCKLYKKGNKKGIEEQISRYKSDGFPLNYGLLEGSVIVRSLQNDKGKKLLELWWNEFNETTSNRDQLSLPYTLWKNNYQINDIGLLGNDLFRDKRVDITLHK